MNKVANIQGRRFGRWIVLERADNQIVNNHSYIAWLCRCDCGKEQIVRSTTLMRGKSKSCGCFRVALMKSRTKEGAAFREVLARYKANAKRVGREFLLTEEECLKLFSSNCTYCNAVPSLVNEACSGELFYYNGIDRVDSSKGYVSDNCVTSCFMCNRMKSDFNSYDFVSHCLKIVEHTGGKNVTY